MVKLWHNTLGLYLLIFIVIVEALLFILEINYLYHIPLKVLICGCSMLFSMGETQYAPIADGSDADASDAEADYGGNISLLIK